MTSLGTTTEPLKSPATLTATLATVLRHSFARFLMAGGISAGVDVALLYILHGLLNVQLTIATFSAVLAAFIANFLLNRAWSFDSESAVGIQFVRYLILAGLNWISTVVLVSGLAAVGLHYLLAKLVTLAVNAAVNYFAYRHWVFKQA